MSSRSALLKALPASAVRRRSIMSARSTASVTPSHPGDLRRCSGRTCGESSHKRLRLPVSGWRCRAPPSMSQDLTGMNTGYPRMNADEGFLLREANPHYPCPSSFSCRCHPVFPLAALPLASISLGLTGMNTGYPRMNTGYGMLLRGANSYHPCSSWSRMDFLRSSNRVEAFAMHQ
jgi:hypothetical protein